MECSYHALRSSLLVHCPILGISRNAPNLTVSIPRRMEISSPKAPPEHI